MSPRQEPESYPHFYLHLPGDTVTASVRVDSEHLSYQLIRNVSDLTFIILEDRKLCCQLKFKHAMKLSRKQGKRNGVALELLSGSKIRYFKLARGCIPGSGSEEAVSRQLVDTTRQDTIHWQVSNSNVHLVLMRQSF